MIDQTLLKEHAVAFADWKKEYEFCEHFIIQRAYKKAGGIVSHFGSTTSDLYDKWMERSIMSYEEAMKIVQQGGSVTRPRLHAVHQISFRLHEGRLRAYHDQEGFDGISVKAQPSEEDKRATDWIKLDLKQ